MSLNSIFGRWTAPLLGLSFLFTASQAADWPHWLGPNGDNIAPEKEKIETDLNKWQITWQTNVGRGYASVIVANGHAYTLGHDEQGKETIYCYAAITGKEVWKRGYPAQLLPRMHPGGPNATPAVSGDNLLTLSKDGQLYCFSASKGEERWKANLTEVLGVKLPQWGFASSPVVEGDQVFVSAGKVAALELKTGKAVWVSKTDYPAGYTTPVVFKREGKSYVAALDGKGLAILNAKDGSEVARYPFVSAFDLNATTPVILDEGTRILISGNQASQKLLFDGKTLAPGWATTEVKNAMNNSVILDGILYGIDGKQQNAQSRFVAVDIADGKILSWQPNFGFGTTIGIGKGHILALTENGELVLAKASPKSYLEISRRQVLGKLCWTTPTYANQRIYVRNDHGDILCLAQP